MTLRHGEGDRLGEEVDVVVTASARSLHVARRAEVMGAALRQALDAVEHELLSCEEGGAACADPRKRTSSGGSRSPGGIQQ